jgi:Family of unknown function (DUF5641)
MGNLPLTRVSPSPPFTYSGIDFAGPFHTRMAKGRGTKTQKGYISVFVCMVTKAIYLELVGDLSTNAFLAAYKRFTACRGNCREIHSDNGTNFVGANTQLNKELNLAIKQATSEVASLIANDGTTWKFIPVATPHFGGLWEASVKAVKSHLKTNLSNTTLTFEEFCTVLHQIEACLNSRPLTQLSNDPNDLQALIGRPIIAPPEPSVLEKNPHTRWKLLTKLTQKFWLRWSLEYLNTLQQRSKWRRATDPIKEGEIVLIKQQNLPTTKWMQGRVILTHPGEDGLPRAVTVQAQTKL